MKRLLALLAALALPPAIYFPAIAPRLEEKRRHAEEQIRDLDMRIEMARTAQRMLPQFREETLRLAQEVEKLRRILPPSLEVDQIREIAASGHGVRLTRFEAGTPRNRDHYQEVSIDVEVIGTAAATSAFLREMANKARIIDVSRVTMHKEPAGWRSGFVMTSYAM